MPSSNRPDSSEVRISGPLSNVANDFDQRADYYVADQFFGVVNVDNERDKYCTFGEADACRDDAKPRQIGDTAAEGGWSQTWTEYVAEEFAWRHPIYDRNRRGAAFNEDAKATRKSVQKLRIREEAYFAANFFVTGKWGSNEISGAALPDGLWSSTGSDPFYDIGVGKRAILLGCGNEANRFAVGYDVHLSLVNHPNVIERVKHVAGSSFNIAVNPEAPEALQAMASAFGVGKYLVSKARKTTSAENAATATFGFICSYNALLGFCEPEPSIDTPSAGYIFRVRSESGSDQGINIKTYRDDDYARDWIESGRLEAMKQVHAAAAYFFLAPVAAI